jgi:HEAT repeat protein
MALLIVFNYGLSLTYLFRQGKMTVSITVLNLVQLALFCRLHALIHDLLGAGHYSYALSPHWSDWVELVAVHVLRAVDLLDVLGAYGIHLQNVKHQSTLTGMVLFSMHIMVDIFLLGALFMRINRRFASQQASTLMNLQRFVERFKGTLDFLKRIRLWGLGVATVLIIIVGIANGWDLRNWLLWPLDNLLRTLDFGDAFQIFDWQLHSLEMGLWLATLAVFFRLVVSFYVFGPANRFYLYQLGGRGKTIDELVRISTSPESSEEEKDIAFNALTRFGSSAVPPLVEVLAGSESNDVRRTIIEALGEIGPAANKAIPSLMKLLVDSDSDVRWTATVALEERIDPQWSQNEYAQSAIPHLVTALADRQSDVRMAAANTLKRIDPQWPQNEYAQSAILHLVTALADSESDIRKAAADTLGKMGPSAVTAVPHLMKVLVDGDYDVRRFAADSLERIDSQWPQNKDAQSTISHIVTALANSESDIRRTAAEVLGKMGPAAAKAVPHLVKALADSTREVRQAAADALGQIGPAAVKAVPHLVKALANSDSEVRKAAADALERIDSQWRQSEGAQSAIPYLVKALVDGKNEVRRAAADALKRIIDPQWRQSEGAQSAIPYFVKALVDSKNEVRRAAADSLERIDPQWRQSEGTQIVIPYFVKALVECGYDVRMSAADALGQIGPAAVKAVPYLVKALSKNDCTPVRNDVRVFDFWISLLS